MQEALREIDEKPLIFQCFLKIRLLKNQEKSIIFIKKNVLNFDPVLGMLLGGFWTLRPGTLPNSPMTPPRRPQTLPRCAYRHLRWLQDLPRTSQYASKSAQEASKVPQDSPRTPPRPSRGRFFELWWWIWGGFPFPSPELSQKRWNQAWIQSSTLNMPIPACPHTFLLQDTAVPA